MKDLLKSLISSQPSSQSSQRIAAEPTSKRRKTENDMSAAVSSPASSQDPAMLPIHRVPEPNGGVFRIDQSQSGFTPPPSGQLTGKENVFPSGFASMANLQDIADFDRENPYTPKAQPPKLIPTSSRGNCANIVKFQLLCDQHSIKPVFTFTEVFQGGFTAKVIFDNNVVEITEPHLGKKAAKEALCALAILKLPKVEKSSRKRKHSAAAQNTEPEENWVGILQEHCQKNRLAMPNYQESCTTTLPVRFGCTVSVSGAGPLVPHGANLGPFTSKREARAASAREAVLWLRGAGLIPETPLKRKKESSTPSESPAPHGHTGLTQAIQDVGMVVDSPGSLPQQVHDLVASLGFLQPEWPSQRSTAAFGELIPPGAPYYDMAAWFQDRDVATEPRLAGPIGKVERVFGIKNAKKACCKRVLPLLEEIQRSRAR